MKQAGALGWPRDPSSLEVSLGGIPRRSRAVVECTGLLGGDMLFSKVLKLHAGHEQG